MRPDANWFNPIVWLMMLAVALVCGLIVIGQAFETHIYLIDDYSLQVSADYSADPPVVRVAQIAPVSSDVISDTVRDLVAEQAQAPLLGMLLTEPTETPLQVANTPTLSLARRPTATPTIGAAVPVTASSPAPSATSIPLELAVEPGRPTSSSSRPSRTSVPVYSTSAPVYNTPVPTSTRAPRPTATARPTSTARPTVAPTALPTAVPTALPTSTPTDIPTATPTDIPTATPTDIPTATPTDIPTAAPDPPSQITPPPDSGQNSTAATPTTDPAGTSDGAVTEP